MKKCKLCGGEIPPKRAKWSFAKYCSVRCNANSYSRRHGKGIPPIYRACVICTESFLPGLSHPLAQCCSKRCGRKWDYRTHKVAYRARGTRWGKANLDKVRLYQRRHYAKHRTHMLTLKKLRSSGELPLPEWIKLCELQDYKCVWCEKQFPLMQLSVDHIIPITRGGTHDRNNLQAMCFPCNRRKGNRFIGAKPPTTLPDFHPDPLLRTS